MALKVSCLAVLSLLVTVAVAGPVSEKQPKTKNIRKRNVSSMDDLEMANYQNQILPGMVDDQVAEAFLKDAAEQEEREHRRAEEAAEEEEERAEEEAAEKSRQQSEEEEEEAEQPREMQIALPMSRIGDEVLYAEDRPTAHRSKALSGDMYPVDEGDTYMPYYPSPSIYFRRRRRSRPVMHTYRKRSTYTPVMDLLRSGKLRSTRRKRQIRISDDDLGALISFLTDLKVSIEKSAADCRNPAHHSFFRENELNEELGAGSGIDDDYNEDEAAPSPEQEYPVWLMPHSYPIEQVLGVPQRRSLYYPSMVPGQKRSSPPANVGYRPTLKNLENKLFAWGGGRAPDVGPPMRFFQ